MTLTMNDDVLYALQPTSPGLSRKLPGKPPRPAPKVAERVTSPIGRTVAAIAAAVVIVALLLSIGSARDATQAARTDAAAARAETATANAALDDATSKLIAETNARAAASAQVALKDRQLADQQALAVRAGSCIDGLLNVMDAMVNSTFSSTMRAFDKATPLCRGLGPLLRGTGSSALS